MDAEDRETKDGCLDSWIPWLLLGTRDWVSGPSWSQWQTQDWIDLRPASGVAMAGAGSDEVPLSILSGYQQPTVQAPATKRRGLFTVVRRRSMTRGIGRGDTASAEFGPVRE